MPRSLDEQFLRVRFFFRHALARVRYVPLRLYLNVSEKESINFSWGYWPASFVEDRSVFHREWLGSDIAELRFISKALRPGMTFMDIGAYHGIYSIIAGKRVGRSGRVIAFEPSPRERRMLRFHSALNPSPRIEVESYAVGSSSGTKDFFVAGNGMEMMNSLHPPRTEAPVKSVQVSSVTLDNYCSLVSLDRVHYIKIDVEGGELPLLKSGTKTISQHRPVVICELLDWVTEPWGHTARDTALYLESLDYEWFEFCDDGMVQRHIVRDQYPTDVRNFLAIPREKVDEFDQLRLIRKSGDSLT